MREIKHLSVHQWLRSAISDSQQPTSPIGFLFLKLPPPPCAVLLVVISNRKINGEKQPKFWSCDSGNYNLWLVRGCHLCNFSSIRIQSQSQHAAPFLLSVFTLNFPAGCLSNPRFNRMCFWPFLSSHKTHHFLTFSCEGVRVFSRNFGRPFLLNFCKNSSGGHFFPSFCLHSFFHHSLFFTSAWFFLFA